MLRKGRVLYVRIHPEAKGGDAHCAKIFAYRNGECADVPYGTNLHFPKGINIKATMPGGEMKQWGRRWPEGVTMLVCAEEGGEPYLEPVVDGEIHARGIRLRFAQTGTMAKVARVPR
jgi:hypothetical protein